MKIRPVSSDDFPQWLVLWNANNLGHKDEDVTTQTWARLHDENTHIFGLVAEDKGILVGLLQYVVHPTTGSVSNVCYMQDVFVSPERREEGIAKRLIQKLESLARQENWARIYWMAEEDNKAAQALYKNLGQKMNFSFHVLSTHS